MNREVLRKMGIGCVGALTPILINLLIVDLQTTLSNVTLISAFFYMVRVGALCAAACIVVFLNSDESKPVKLFQLGMAAPALLTGMLNASVIANNHNTSSPPSAQNAPAQPTRGSEYEAKRYFTFGIPSVIGSAQAQEAGTTAGIFDCTKPQAPTFGQQVLKGLVGIVPDNQWFVVVGSNPTAESALADVSILNHRFSGKFHAKVCAPTSRADNRYRVVIGEYLTYPEATKLKLDAIGAGFPGETWVWNPVLSAKG
jgi:hypothetical protein